MATATESVSAFGDHFLNFLPTANSTEAISAVQDQVLDAVRRSQDAFVGFVDTWARTVASLMPDSRPLPFADKLPDTAGMVEGTFAFVDRLLTAQKDFAVALLDAARPVFGGNGEAGANGRTAPRRAARSG